MKPLLVASVPHCGTFFTYDLLPGRHGSTANSLEAGRKYWGHIGEARCEELIPQCLAITPLRRYEDVKRSWTRRGLSLAKLHDLWDRMLSLPLYRFQIDGADRDEQLNRLSELIGTRLVTDWTPVNRAIL